MVAADEWILRRVHKNHYDSTLPHSVHFAAFRPNKHDVTGLSVFRELDISAERLASTGRHPGEYLVVRLSVDALRSLGLTIVLEEDPGGLPGHAVIPELSISTYENDKQRLKEVLIELARMASESIAYRPVDGT